MRSFRWHPALAMALVAVGVVTACETVPYTGRSQLQFMSPQQESELGAQAYQQTLAKTKLSATVQAVASLLGAGATVGVLLPGAEPRSRKPTTWDSSLMAKAGYDPHPARDLWVRIAAASKGSGKPPEFLSTHPSEPTRIQQIEVWMAEAIQVYHPR